MLIATAYRVQEFQISGGPGWAASERLDVEGKAEDSQARRRAVFVLTLFSRCSPKPSTGALQKGMMTAPVKTRIFSATLSSL